VIKLNDLEARDVLGWTTRHPRWAFAFKFPPRKEVTRILSILPSVGRTGVVTPVAIMLPVEIGGVTVSRATLHNREEVARKDVREGDRVRVQRAGDVIPQVIERIEEPDRERAPEWRMPDVCPSCGTPLTERGPFTVCPNSFECPAQLAGRIVHFASRNALDIEGLGAETAKLFVSEGLVKQLPDLFDIQADRLVKLEGFAEKSANNLVDALRKAASKVELPRFLYALGIPEVGTAVARDLARHFGSFERLRAADDAALQEVQGVGPRMAEQITSFFAQPDNAEVLDALVAKLNLQEEQSKPAAGSVQPFAGLKFVFTGGMSRFSRKQAQELVESLGGRATGSVSKSTDWVIVGEDAGSKAEDAQKLGVKTLDENGFVELLRENGANLALKEHSRETQSSSHPAPARREPRLRLGGSGGSRGERKPRAHSQRHREGGQDRRGVEEDPHSGAVPGAAQEGHRARLHRRVLGQPPQGRLRLRGLRPAAVQLGDQVRVGHGLAERLAADRSEERGDRDRPQPLHEPHRGALRPLRRPPRPRLHRRPPPHRPALLHELGVAQVRARQVSPTDEHGLTRTTTDTRAAASVVCPCRSV
jgi:hypothetical protein